MAEASKRTVYNHFESTKDLLWAVIAEFMAGQTEMTQIPHKTDSLESQFGRFVDALMYFVTDSARLSIVRLLTSIFLQSQELRDEAIAVFLSRYSDV
jgi:AcrR family transcriptional regulator